jgi:hypothetical protein
MMTEDFSTLFRRIGRSCNKKVKINDLEEFACWIHVISDPVIMKVYGGTNQLERNAFKDEIVRTLKSRFGMTLSPNYDSMTISKNQVNIMVFVMS